MDGWIGLDWIGCPGKRLAKERRPQGTRPASRSFKNFPKGAVRVVLLVAVGLVQYVYGTTTEVRERERERGRERRRQVGRKEGREGGRERVIREVV